MGVVITLSLGKMTSPRPFIPGSERRALTGVEEEKKTLLTVYHFCASFGRDSTPGNKGGADKNSDPPIRLLLPIQEHVQGRHTDQQGGCLRDGGWKHQAFTKPHIGLENEITSSPMHWKS